MKNPFKIASEYLKWANDHDFYGAVSIKFDHGTILKVEFSCQARSYKNVHEFARKFKLKLDKKQSATKGALDYSHASDSLDIKFYAIGELAPNCRVEYKKVKIPAQKARTETQAIVVCS